MIDENDIDILPLGEAVLV